MRSTKNQAFTLVELIVVITILAILGTIAFISLQGYSQDAKNAKIGSDLSSIAKKITIRTTDVSNAASLNDILLWDTSSWTLDHDSWTFGSGAIVIGATGTSYKVWTVDFVQLQESKDDFVDNDKRDYLYGFAAFKKNIMYQVAGQIKDAAGLQTAVVKWNFYGNGNNEPELGLIISNDGTHSIVNEWEYVHY